MEAMGSNLDSESVNTPAHPSSPADVEPGAPDIVNVTPGVRLDNWQNPITGKGTEQDRTEATLFAREPPLQWDILAALYYQDDIAARIVDAVVKEALRLAPRVKAPAGISEESRKRVQDRLEKLRWVEVVKQAGIFARLFGDAFVFPAQDANQQEDPTPGQPVLWLKHFDRRDLAPFRYERNPLREDYGEPLEFSVASARGNTTGLAGGGAFIKATRLVRMYGVRTDAWERMANGGWNYSVLQRIIRVVRDVQQAWDGISYLLSEASVKVAKIKGLIQGLSTARKNITERLELLNETIGNSRMAVLDADKEDLQRVELGTLQGAASVLEIICARLASAAEMPVTILMGQAPAGLNATGDADTRSWYATVGAYQEQELKPVLIHLIGMVVREYGGDPTGWTTEFPSLWAETPKEEREGRKQFVDELNVLVTATIITPEEAALRLVEWDADTSNPYSGLDTEARKLIVAGRFLDRPEEDPLPAPAPAVPQAPPSSPQDQAPANLSPSPPEAPGAPGSTSGTAGD